MKTFILIIITFFAINSFATTIQIDEWHIDQDTFDIYAQFGSKNAEDLYNSLLFEPLTNDSRKHDSITRIKSFQTKDEVIKISCTRIIFMDSNFKEKPDDYFCSIKMKNTEKNSGYTNNIYESTSENYLIVSVDHNYKTGSQGNIHSQSLYQNLDIEEENGRGGKSKTFQTTDKKIKIKCYETRQGGSIDSYFYSFSILINQ